MDDERLVDIETKLAHQELLVEQLNDVVTAQEMRIASLETTCRSLAERLRSLGETTAASANRPEDDLPPHY